MSIEDKDIKSDTQSTDKASETITLTHDELQEQLREAYNKGLQTGFISATKQVRSEINDYLSDLIASVKNNNQ